MPDAGARSARDEASGAPTGVTLDLDALDFAKGGGLVTVVAQDAGTGAILMVAHADREALERTLASGEMHYRSRSRGAWHKGATSGNVQRVVALSADCDGDAVLAQVLPAGPACHTGAVSCFGDRALAADAFGALARTIEARAVELTLRATREGAAERGVEPGTEPGTVPGAEAGTEPGTEPGGVRARGAPPEPQDSAAAAASRHHSVAAETSPSRAPSYTARLLGDRNLRLKKLGEESAELVTACADGDAARAAEEGVDLFYHALVALRAVGVRLDDLRRVARRRAR